MMQLNYLQDFFASSRGSAQRSQSLWSLGSRYRVHDVRLRVYRLASGSIILPNDLDIPEPEQEIALGVNAPEAQQIKIAVQNRPMLMGIHPEIYEETAQGLTARGMGRDDRHFCLALR